jgi:iron(III) transport system permease protein
MGGLALRGAALALFAVILVLPAGVLLADVLFPEGKLSFAVIGTVLNDARQWGLLGNTLFLGVGAGGVAFLLGFPLAFLLARTNLPAKATLSALALGPLFFPPLVHAIAWTGLTGLRGGLAAILIFGFAYSPVVVVLASRALQRVDARHEEAALLAGGPWLRARIALGAALPSALSGAIICFVFAVSDFSVPDYLSSVGPKFNVYADEVFTRWQRAHAAGEAMAAALPPIAAAFVGILGIAWLRRGGRARMVTSQFAEPVPFDLGLLRWPAFLFSISIVGVTFAAPLLRLAWVANSVETLRSALHQARGDWIQTVFASACAALLVAAVASVVAHLAARAKPAGARALDFAVLLVFAMPALALAVALIRAWNREEPIGLVYDGAGVVVLALAARTFAFGYFALANGFASLDPSLEDAGRLAGLSLPRRFFSINIPLVRPALATALFLVFLFGMRELDALVILPSGNRSVMFRIYNAIHFNRPEFVAALSLILAFLTALPLALFALLAKRGAQR